VVIPIHLQKILPGSSLLRKAPQLIKLLSRADNVLRSSTTAANTGSVTSSSIGDYTFKHWLDRKPASADGNGSLMPVTN